MWKTINSSKEIVNLASKVFDLLIFQITEHAAPPFSAIAFELLNIPGKWMLKEDRLTIDTISGINLEGNRPHFFATIIPSKFIQIIHQRANLL